MFKIFPSYLSRVSNGIDNFYTVYTDKNPKIPVISVFPVWTVFHYSEICFYGIPYTEITKYHLPEYRVPVYRGSGTTVYRSFGKWYTVIPVLRYTIVLVSGIPEFRNFFLPILRYTVLPVYPGPRTTVFRSFGKRYTVIPVLRFSVVSVYDMP